MLFVPGIGREGGDGGWEGEGNNVYIIIVEGGRGGGDISVTLNIIII